ncbi:MAG: arginine--tRNA ligase [Candidatus Eisenbacteria bacterium]|uniref:Arginine--tRNA ligase n=1 Tax=Eiseniibacteriota bacterium TaxID=2212470 RepID=A0A849SRL3_UNCEI|nr:arginine--tRNA ligase [Candidatus Eisenbacteria bacterium]
MVWTTLTEGLREALRVTGLEEPGRLDRLELAIPRDPSHGDWTTNLALGLAREVGRPPRAIAEQLAGGFPVDAAIFATPEVAGPGFLNFRYSESFVASLAAHIRREAEQFGTSRFGAGETVIVEYVSANPTGPLNVVSARAAAVGATLVRLLNATGHAAVGEFYVNDAGNQVELLGESLASRFAERIGVERPLPEQGYQGEYVRELAAQLPEAPARAALAATNGSSWFRDQALTHMLAWQQRDLSDYGAEFARWFRETELHRSGAVADTLSALEARGMIYRARQSEAGSAERGHEADEEVEERGDATFVRSSGFGDDQDRVVVKSSGATTYLLPDIAYHRDKHARGFRHAIDLWGPDHHGYIPRMKASLQALGLAPDFLEVLIVQQVNLLAAGQPVKMSKRAGEFVTLRDLMDDVGADCAKFFFLMRSTSAHLDFDLDLAKQQNDENPAYYVQYAHARIASLLRFADERGHAMPALEAGPAPVTVELAAEERTLLRKLAAFPEVVRGAAATREPHRIPTYLHETAAEFHRFYHHCRVVSDDRVLTAQRLAVCEATRRVLANGLALLGVTAPDRMARAEAEDA